MLMCTEIKIKVRFLSADQNKYVFKQDLGDDSDGAHLTSFGIVFLAEEEAI